MFPRVVLVRRKSEYEELLGTHGSHGQAAFFLESRGRSIASVQQFHARLEWARTEVQRSIPRKWRSVQLLREELDRFLFEPEDVVVAVGQDGLVANTAKYLSGQPVIGVNPEPARYDGVLVRHRPSEMERLMVLAIERRAQVETRTMVEARLDDGQTLLALNEIFVGHRSHQSARYSIHWGSTVERHSSSGLIVATGTGATGWARSIHKASKSHLTLPTPTEPQLVFFVREAFPSVATGTDIVEGLVEQEEPLTLVSEMNFGGVIFGDGLEGDCLPFRWGQRLQIQRSDNVLQLVV